MCFSMEWWDLITLLQSQNKILDQKSSKNKVQSKQRLTVYMWDKFLFTYTFSIMHQNIKYILAEKPLSKWFDWDNQDILFLVGY